MILFIILSFLDLLTGLLFYLFLFGVGGEIVILFALYLIIKSLFFIPDFASSIDIFAGGYILFVVFLFGNYVFNVLVVVWFLQKSFSVLSSLNI